MSVAAEQIDLTGREAFVRAGFERSWTESLPNGPEWKAIPAARNGVRSLRISEIMNRRRPFLSLQSVEPEDFTIVTSFDLSESTVASPRIKALLLAQIGLNWQIYLNGTLVDSRIPRAPGGELVSRTMRNALIPIDSRVLGRHNILTLRIIGDPTSTYTGLHRSTPYLFGDLSNLESIRNDTPKLILISLYLMVGAFHLGLFLRKTGERFNLYFGLLATALFAYYFQRSNAIYGFIYDSDLLLRIDTISLMLIVPFGISFLDSLFRQRLSIVSRIFWVYSALLITLALPTPTPFSRDVLSIWQATLPLALGYAMFVILRELIEKISEYRRFYSLPLWRAVFRAIVRSPAGNLLLGVVCVSACALFEVFDSVTAAHGRAPTVYALFFFVAGVTTILANRIIDIYSKIEALNSDLSDRLKELQVANDRIRTSEERYRQLIEGSTEIIFIMDSNFKVLTINKSAQRHLGFHPEDLIGTSMMDLLYQGDLESGLALDLIQRRLSEFMKTGKIANLKLSLKAKYTQEPREFSVRLEKIKLEEETQILGKAMLVIEDSLLKYFVRESQKYVIGNYLTSAEELSQRVVRNLEKYLDPGRVTAVRIGLREVVINAIEHGNLAITYDEKTRELNSGNYLEFIQKRQADPTYRDRKVVVEYELRTVDVVYTITDDGSGFDHRAIRARETIHQQDSHGRGIAVTENAFDEVIYNEVGNSVKLIKNFRR